MPKIVSSGFEKVVEQYLTDKGYEFLPQYRLEGFSKRWRMDFYLPKSKTIIDCVNVKSIYRLEEKIYSDLFKLLDLAKVEKYSLIVFSSTIPLCPTLKVLKEYNVALVINSDQLFSLLSNEKTIEEIYEEVLTLSPYIKWTRTRCVQTLLELYKSNGKVLYRTNWALGRACRRHFGSWNKALIKAKVPINQPYIYGIRKIPLKDHEQICNLYKEGESTITLGEKYRIRPSTIETILKNNNVTLRSRGEAMKIACAKGRRG